jgi:hypothetical protein
LLSDEARAFERYDHLVNGRRGDSKVFLDVGLGRRPAMQARIEVDVGQILALLGREGFCGRTHFGGRLAGRRVRICGDSRLRIWVR